MAELYSIGVMPLFAARNAFTRIEQILMLTAFAAGTVDLISFATLGGVFASAMTGNFALLAYYVARNDAPGSMGSVMALCGFVLGCALGVLQKRSREPHHALSLLLLTEGGLLLCFVLYSRWMPPAADSAAEHLQIVLLAVAMGVQAVIGQSISLTTIVFTTTLTKLVTSLAGSLASRDAAGLADVKIQSAVVISYLFGALLAGTLIVHKSHLVAYLPLLGVMLAYLIHGRSR